jgi:nucleoside 2-deoxyribosyltransferase
VRNSPANDARQRLPAKRPPIRSTLGNPPLQSDSTPMTPPPGLSPARPRIYLAGPDVFLPDAKTFGAEKKRLCAAAGFEGCFPLDADLALDGLDPLVQARQIAAACETMMRSCDLAIANCTPFRGVSMDVGTAYEVGFMRALGRPVFGYSNAADTYAHRAAAFRGAATDLSDAKDLWDCDRPAIEIENFDQPENLMIAAAFIEAGLPMQIATTGARADMKRLDAFIECLEAVRRQLL